MRDRALATTIDAPVILLGRGGSGTRMMSEIARGLGVFLGNHVNVTGDSIEWVDSLYALAIESLAIGIHSPSGRDLYWRDRLRTLAADVCAAGDRRATAPWGWKLPETMLVLAPVLRTFPTARIIHLVRHPVTSALRRTHMTSRMDNAIGQAVLPAAYRFCGLDPQRLHDDEIHVHNAVTWAFQIGSVLDVVRAHNPRILQIHYEAMCLDPGGAQAAVAHFLDLDIPASAIVPDVDVTRLNTSVMHDVRSQRVWSICGSLANDLGYDASGLNADHARLS